MIPKNIKKEHLEKAIEEIDKDGIRKGRHSSIYDLIHNGKSYPPKLVLSIANRYANGTELDANDFGGGKDTPAFELMKTEGFEIVLKNDPIISLIEKYKKRIAETELKDEIYKWELVNEYRGRPNTGAPDFYQEIKDIKFKNLIYAMGMAVINHLAKDRPEELRQLFIKLYDEDKDLTERVKSFNKETLKIYRALGESLGHHQDERSIATYLTFHNSEKYTFYKSAFYKKYCELIGVKEANKNEKYTHYLTLIDELIENYISTDNELIEQVNTLIPDFYNGTNHKLLAQDILFQMLDKKEEINYWIFQGNPKVFDFETALRDEILTDWTVSSYKDKIKTGDKVILWITGSKSGCYALAEVLSEPYEKTSSSDDHLWKSEVTSTLTADIKITHNFVDSPILKSKVDSLVELRDLKVGNQGTNFSATKDEFESLLGLAINKVKEQYWIYAPGKNAELWDEFYEQGIMGLGWDELGDLNDYSSKEELKTKLQELEKTTGSKKNDSTANFEFKDVISIGDVIISKKGRGELLGYGIVTSDYYYDKERTRFQKCRKVNWEKKGNWKTDHSLALKTLTDITKFLPEHADYNTYYERLLGIMGQNNQTKKLEDMNIPLNTILYGPPGTGKTYRLKNEFFEKFTDESANQTEEEYLQELVSNYSWWEVIAASLYDLKTAKVLNISEHPFLKAKVAVSSNNNVRATLWGTLQAHTIEECEHVNYTNRQAPLIFNKNENSVWEIIEANLESEAPEIIELVAKSKDFNPVTTKKKRYVFTTFHQSFSYEDFIEGIKPIIYEDEQNPERGKQVIYDIKSGLFKKIVKEANEDRDNDYAIFIDEINRGNIANIFGELITLIEDDKRIDTDNYIPVKLPYSGEPFGVPPNLFIIGTMNTADRSVEALDTALRRRFSFIEMNPEPQKLSEPKFKCEGIDLEKLLFSINGRIEKLLDKDYCIGHSYFMTIKNRQEPLEEIKTIFENKILPLLQEYFYGDWGKIMLVIGNKFIVKKEDPIKFLSNGLDDEYDEYNEKTIYNFTKSSSWSLDSFKSIYE